MLEITYTGVLVFITLAWIVTRVICGIRNKKVDWKHEAKLLTVYICLVVIARFVYFPLHLVEGRIASLIFDVEKIIPPWINLVPIVHLFDVYDGAKINIIGNIMMFIPVGLTLPFYDRCSDVDDLILNTTGILIGAFIYFGIKRLTIRKKRVS